MVRPVREEKSPDEIMEHLKNHPVDVRSLPPRRVPTDLKKRMVDEWVRRKLGLTE